MTADAVQKVLSNNDIALCFDTSAIYGNRVGPALLEAIRERFPTRKLLIPAWVVAEKTRDLKAIHGPDFRLEEIEGFLQDDELDLNIVAFDENVSLNGWLEVTERLGPKGWKWEKRDLPKVRKEQPCAERCRSGDYIVYAIARTHKALLVTEDKELREQVERDGTYPGVITARELAKFVGFP